MYGNIFDKVSKNIFYMRMDRVAELEGRGEGVGRGKCKVISDSSVFVSDNLSVKK